MDRWTPFVEFALPFCLVALSGVAAIVHGRMKRPRLPIQWLHSWYPKQSQVHRLQSGAPVLQISFGPTPRDACRA